MKLMLKEIFETASSRRDFECELYEIDAHLPVGFALRSPLSLRGNVYNRAGVVTLDYSISALMTLTCDRCLLEFENVFEYDFSHILVTELNGDADEDEYVVCKNTVLELDELAISDLLLQLPSKILCREDCRGLCSKCGHNLNDGDCGCSESE